MRCCFLWAVLWASFASAAPLRFAAPGLSGVGLDPAKVTFYSDHLAQQLSQEPDIRCMTTNEIGALLGLERQRQLLGCDDSAGSCLAEFANALGGDGMIIGSIGKLGDQYQVNVRIVSARGNGNQLGAASATAHDEASVLGLLNTMAGQLASQARKSMGRADPHSGALRRISWLPLAIGVAAGVAGGVFLVQSESASARLRAGPDGDHPASIEEAQSLRDSGAVQQTLARIGFGVAGAGLITAALFFFLGAPEADKPVLVLTPWGASFGFAF